MEILIREISEPDAAEVTSLSAQLGYDLSIEQTLENIKAVVSRQDHNAFVAMHENKIVGWVGVCEAIQIESPPSCEIRGLVVDHSFRNMGIGKLLVEKAKHWCREKGKNKLRLRCNMKRTETHMFYRHLNFKETKEQKVFEIET